MTNQLATRPWKLDTASATAVYLTKLKIAHLEFAGYTDASHKCELTDTNGNLVWSADGDTNLSNQRSGVIGWTDGLILNVLDSGYVLVYFM